MPRAPEPPGKADQIDASSPSDAVAGGAPGEAFDVAHEHARRLLEACDAGDAMRLRPDPRARHPALEWAESGAMALTGAAQGPPRFVSGPLASVARGAVLALHALAEDSGFRELDGAALLGERAAIFGLKRQGDRSAGGSARLLTTRDRPIAVNLPRADDWQLVPAWLADSDGEADDSDSVTPFAGSRARPAPTAAAASEADWRRLERAVRGREADPLVARGRLMGLAVASAEPARDTLAAPPFFVRSHESQAPPAPPTRPIRLLDLSTLWAGPLATSLLARAGIEVLKIESPKRPDGARQGPVAFFDLLHGGKLGCALDLHEARDRGVFEALLERADVVVESARPRALGQLGYDAPGWVTARPGRIWASITGYGRAHEWIAFGDDAAVAAGLAWSPVASETQTCFPGDAIADPLAGLHTAAIVLAHLRKRRGGLVDLSLSGIARRAARATHDGVVRPVERRGEHWVVVEADDESRRPVAPPRARRATRRAPPLAAPSARLLADWTASRC